MSSKIVSAFSALRPTPEVAQRVASVPYDVLDRQEAKVLVDKEELSFLRVGRAEATLSDSVDAYSPEVYQQAQKNLQALIDGGYLVSTDAPSLYLYRLTWKGCSQFGVVGAYSVEAYRTGRIKKHEKTRQAKEDDRTNHILKTQAQTGPVFLVHRPSQEVQNLTDNLLAGGQEPLFSFLAVDGVEHTVWRIDDPQAWESALDAAGDFYIADGHHRAASAERTATKLGADSGHPASRFLAVAFPTDQVKILPYHRVLTEFNGHTAEEVLAKARASFGATLLEEFDESGLPGEPKPGTVSMYLESQWFRLELPRIEGAGVADSLDSAVLQQQFLEPVFGIKDVRSDDRIDFVGGIRGLGELKQRVDQGKAVVAFAMAATSLDDLLAVSDHGEIMPPKSTWFEPKLRDGLLIHDISG